MSILVDKNTKLVVQGITGNEGSFHAKACLEYGTNIVAGVTPGKGGLKFENKVPIYNTVEDAVIGAGANTSIIFVPPPFAADAVMEAADAGVNLIVCITEGIPVLDMMKAKNYAEKRNVKLIGPNCPGVISPNKAKVGIMPGFIHKEGSIGIISRSGTLTDEAVSQVCDVGYGQSTCVGIGGDPIVGSTFVDILKLFKDDNETEAIVMIGEIGGTAEEEAAEYIKSNFTKPVVAFIAGQTAPPGRRMGHAGAIISGGKGTASEKIKTLEESGIAVAKTPAEIEKTLLEVLEKK